ncbi:EamA family transporter RarD [Aeromicrobium sp. IC_218]|uniref:EamA family transporter RarD n=1 Tax=Aeromicrobium sp. IC_218 TaxID=2545468 RepID=UPI00103CF9C5|nr:EamA family transporter RarD [Aeromicrobium sp. IC_218]TCJ00880.1 EamA family transporter RarD [Aeromicrobium sp. IC_218]
MDESRSGLALGVGAYLCWGLFPLYWPLLEPAGALEALSHRVVWSLGFVAILLTVTRRWDAFRVLWRDPVRLLFLALASVVIAINWGAFIWGVTNGHVIETSLGYFINPLVTVLLAVLVLGERLRPVQWVAVGVGAVAVVVLTVDYGRLPYVALAVAASFAIYGFLKKRAQLGAIESLAVETALLTPVAVGYLVFLQLTGSLVFGHEGTANALLLAGTGVVTAVPLLLFGGAATRLSLTSLGLLQYLGPILQFVFGLLVFGEEMSPARWAGFVLVWLALVLFTADALRARRRVLREAAENVAC